MLFIWPVIVLFLLTVYIVYDQQAEKISFLSSMFVSQGYYERSHTWDVTEFYTLQFFA